MQVLTIFAYKKIFLLDCKIQFTFDLDLSFHARIKIQKSILFYDRKNTIITWFLFLHIFFYLWHNTSKNVENSFLSSNLLFYCLDTKRLFSRFLKKHRTNQRKITRKSIHFQLPNFARKKVSSISEIFYLSLFTSIYSQLSSTTLKEKYLKVTESQIVKFRQQYMILSLTIILLLPTRSAKNL